MERRKIIVEVLGMGDKNSCVTIQSVARQVCKYYHAPGVMWLRGAVVRGTGEHRAAEGADWR